CRKDLAMSEPMPAHLKYPSQRLPSFWRGIQFSFKGYSLWLVFRDNLLRGVLGARSKPFRRSVHVRRPVHISTTRKHELHKR
ncbi:unnamed protein product, partial [Calicophoron daubneyi]